MNTTLEAISESPGVERIWVVSGTRKVADIGRDQRNLPINDILIGFSKFESTNSFGKPTRMTFRSPAHRFIFQSCKNGASLLVLATIDVDLPKVQAQLLELSNHTLAALWPDTPPRKQEDSAHELENADVGWSSPPPEEDQPLESTVQIVASAVTPAFTSTEIGASLSELSACCAKLFGKYVIINYWKSTRPKIFEMLFEVKNDLCIAPSTLDLPLDTISVEASSSWAESFVTRCEGIVIDIRQRLSDSLSPRTIECLSLDLSKKGNHS
jgi:hypothetical protein